MSNKVLGEKIREFIGMSGSMAVDDCGCITCIERRAASKELDELIEKAKDSDNKYQKGFNAAVKEQSTVAFYNRYEELIEKANRVDELEKELATEKINTEDEFSNIMSQLDCYKRSLETEREKNKELQRQAEIGKALEWLIENGFEADVYKPDYCGNVIYSSKQLVEYAEERKKLQNENIHK